MQDLINNELSITLPEGFRTMDAEELQRSYGQRVDTMHGYRDEGRHAILTVMWNDSNKLAARIAGAKAIAKRAEKLHARMNKDADYHFEGFFDTQLAGCKARGIRYGYSREGVAYDAQTIIFLHEGCCYSVYYYTHAKLAEQNAGALEAILSSLSFADKR